MRSLGDDRYSVVILQLNTVAASTVKCIICLKKATVRAEIAIPIKPALKTSDTICPEATENRFGYRFKSSLDY